MAVFTEDWGSTLGTTGNGSWGSYATPGFYREFTAADDYLLSSNFITSGLRSGLSFAVSHGIPNGSQYHVGSATGLYYDQYAFLYTKLAEYDGTGLWLSAGMTTSGRRMIFLTKPESTVEWTAGTDFIDFAGEGGPLAFEVWTTYLGSGTWQGTITDSEPKTSVLTFAAGADYTPASLPALAIGGNTYYAYLRVLSSEWGYTAGVAVYDSILRFIGTWATGSGTYEWGGEVLGEPGNVQDRAYGPGDTAGWASTVSITLDNSAGQWGSFAGTGQLPFEGVWNLRQYWSGIGAGTASGSWVDLFTGYLEPDGVTVDYGRGQVKINLQSTIARAAQSIALLDGTAVSVRGLDVPCRQRLLGTIAAVDPDTGTVRIGNVAFSPWEAETGCLLWGTSGISSQSIKIGSSITALGAVIPGGTGTVVLEGDIPPWMTVGAPAWITQAWPNYTARSGGYHPWTYVKSIIDGMPGLTWPADDMAIFTKQSGYSDISPNDRLYGGEKLTTALSGIMRAINGFYSVDPSGNFRARCLLPTFSVSGTVDFNAAYDSDWQMSYEPAYSGIEMDCSYNVAAGSFTEHVSVGGTQPWGEVRDVESRWVGSGIEAQSIAGRLYRNAYLPRPSLTLRLAGSRWADYLPGNIYAVHNLPAQVTSLLSGTQMILYSRTYDWADDLTAFEFVAMPGGNYAVWDGTPADYWEGSGKVWF